MLSIYVITYFAYNDVCPHTHNEVQRTILKIIRNFLSYIKLTSGVLDIQLLLCNSVRQTPTYTGGLIFFFIFYNYFFLFINLLRRLLRIFGPINSNARSEQATLFLITHTYTILIIHTHDSLATNRCHSLSCFCLFVFFQSLKSQYQILN